MRGKPIQAVVTACFRRNIPAYAGKTRTQTGFTINQLEHPRVCGENRYTTLRKSYANGTSPRMRGKPEYTTVRNTQRRNIPAYAGKTHATAQKCWFPTEHPRVCGENSGVCVNSVTITGTSPRMRGKRPAAVAAFVNVRNIPAYAGKTTRRPTLCGTFSGTSPRMRGKLNQRQG